MAHNKVEKFVFILVLKSHNVPKKSRTTFSGCRNGFTYFGYTAVEYMPDLPLHYKDDRLALFQMPLRNKYV